MYAVVSSGGKQYRVEPGSTLVLERLSAQPGSAVTFDRVLLVGDGDQVTIGKPTVAGATVRGTVLGNERGPKLVIYKFRQKVKYRRRTGHRQELIRVRIDAISADGVTTEVEDKPKGARRASAARKAPAEGTTSSRRKRPAVDTASAPASTPEEKPASVKKTARSKKAVEE
jgi:large subunit ribosomal protein L21